MQKETLKPIKKFNEIAYVLATVLCSLGVSLSAKSGFGVSMVVAPAFVLSNYLQPILPFFTFGNTEYVVQGLMIIALVIVVRKFKIKYPLSFLTAVIYGLLLDLFRMIVGVDVPEQIYLRIIYMILGAVITAMAIALYLRTYLPQQGYDLFVYELATEKKLNMTKVKWAYDVISLVAAIALMLILFRKFDLELIGVGTLILTVINTPLISLFGNLYDKFISFDPMFPAFATKAFRYKTDEE